MLIFKCFFFFFRKFWNLDLLFAADPLTSVLTYRYVNKLKLNRYAIAIKKKHLLTQLLFVAAMLRGTKSKNQPASSHRKKWINELHSTRYNPPPKKNVLTRPVEGTSLMNARDGALTETLSWHLDIDYSKQLLLFTLIIRQQVRTRIQ